MEKTEFEKMRSGELYNFTDPLISQSLKRAKDLCLRLSGMTLSTPEYRQTLRELIPGVPDSTSICPPFHCDHGNGIRIGERTFVNYGCTILDGGWVTIGNDVKIGPCCQIYTPQHPHDFMARRQPVETSYAVTIGDDTWLGGGVIVCPGVHIGRRCIVAAGSVVTRDVPDDCLVAGNPATVKKHLGPEHPTYF